MHSNCADNHILDNNKPEITNKIGSQKIDIYTVINDRFFHTRNMRKMPQTSFSNTGCFLFKCLPTDAKKQPYVVIRVQILHHGSTSHN